MAMSISEAVRLANLERQMASIGFYGQNSDGPRIAKLESQIAELLERIDRIEQRKKPGPKPKVANDQAAD